MSFFTHIHTPKNVVSQCATTRTDMMRFLRRAGAGAAIFLTCASVSFTNASAEKLYFNAKEFLPTEKVDRLHKKCKKDDRTLHTVAHHGDWRRQAKHTPTQDSSQCVNLTPNDYARRAEEKYGIPNGLLSALAYVESKCNPYAVHAKGRAHYFKTKGEAVHFVNTMRGQGVRNIDVGYMQLNVPSHISQFRSIDHMLDIGHNIHYAAQLLKQLHKRYGNWPHAVERYRSIFCDASRQYQGHVYKVWNAGHGLRHNYAQRIVASVAVQHYRVKTKHNPNPRVYAVSHAQPAVSVPRIQQPLHKAHSHTDLPKVWKTTYNDGFLKKRQTQYNYQNAHFLQPPGILEQLTKPIAKILKA